MYAIFLFSFICLGITRATETVLLDFETASPPSTVAGWLNYSRTGLSASTWSFANPAPNSTENSTPKCYKISKTSSDPYWTGLEVTFSSSIPITTANQYLHVLVYKNTSSRIALTYTPEGGYQTSDAWQSKSVTGRWTDYVLPVSVGVNLKTIAVKIADDAGDYYFDQILLSDSPAPLTPSIVSIYPALRNQTMEGWGGSLCWWANIMGGFSDSKIKIICDWITDPVNGLNMNVFRFNIGGGDDPAHNHMRSDGGAMPGYKASATAPYDWSQDANQRKILQQLIASRIAKKGVNDIQLVAFSNSPPYWMTKSGCSAGNSSGSVCNLKADMFDDFADYLTEVVKYYHDSYGITFNWIEPFNEPFSTWWAALGGQEGCYFGQSDQNVMIRELYNKLQSKEMTSYCSITAMDANSIDEGYSGLQGYISAGDIVSKINRIDVHSYGGTKRKALADLAASVGKKIWQSESGPLYVSGTSNDQIMQMANRIVTDIKELKCPAWIDWQIGAGIGGPQWGLILSDYADPFNPLTKSIAFYIRAQFSRYIKPGYTIIDNSNEAVLTALSPDGKELVVTVNNADTYVRRFEIDLSGFTGLGSRIKQIRTRVQEDLGVMNSLSYLTLSGSGFSYDAQPGSVATFIIPVNQTASAVSENIEPQNEIYYANRFLHLNLATATSCQISIFNTLGQLVQTNPGVNAQGAMPVSLNSGFYIVNISAENKLFTRKIRVD